MLRIAILAEDKAGFIKPMAEGLATMLARLNDKGLSVDSKIFYRGLAQLDIAFVNSWQNQLKNVVKAVANRVSQSKKALIAPITQAEYQGFVTELGSYDAVIVVCPLPRSFALNSLSKLDVLRHELKIPFVLYQNYFLATRGRWYQKIVDAGGQGLERFDWYLAASLASDHPLPDLADNLYWPVSEIGHELNGDDLSVDWAKKTQQPFKVLLDFPRKGYEAQRKVQMAAVKAVGVSYTQLAGSYSIADIRQLYREHHGFMMSFRESFGLPLVENQLCGSWIFTPSVQWCPSHFLPDKQSHVDPKNADKADRLGDNFLCYDSQQQLEQMIARCIECHDHGYHYQKNLQTFVQQYPYLYAGNEAELKAFVLKLKDKSINYLSHQQYQSLNSYMSK